MLYLSLDQNFIISFDLPLADRMIPSVGSMDYIYNNAYNLGLPSIYDAIPVQNSIQYSSTFPCIPNDISPIYSITTYNENVLADSWVYMLFKKRSHTISIHAINEYFMQEPIRLNTNKIVKNIIGSLQNVTINEIHNIYPFANQNSMLAFAGILLRFLYTGHMLKLNMVKSIFCDVDNTCKMLYALNACLFAKSRTLHISLLLNKISIPLCNILRPLKLYGNNIPLDIEFSIYRGLPSERTISPPVIKSIQRKRLNSYFW